MAAQNQHKTTPHPIFTEVETKQVMLAKKNDKIRVGAQIYKLFLNYSTI